MKMGSDDFVHSVETLASGRTLQMGGYCSDDDMETTEEPPRYVSPRRYGVCAESYKKGYYKDPYWNKFAHWEHKLFSVIQRCATLRTFCDDDHISFVKAMEIHKRLPGEYFFKEGEAGDGLIIVLEGRAGCHKGDKLTSTVSRGSVVDEAQILYRRPRAFSLMAQDECIVGKFLREDFVDLNIRHEFSRREQRQDYLRSSKVLEMMSDEYIAKLADVLEVRTYEAGTNIITQDEEGKEFFILEKGMARVWKRIADDEQTFTHYMGGELFGERALVQNMPRAMNITAETTCTVLALTRLQFERLLGPISQLHAQQYLTDPRKLIADFYDVGDNRGPAGTLKLRKQNPDPAKHGGESAWFAVYRPTSRDAIYKMLSGGAVGKGLNVKGKSAKQGVLSGFVPFVQISDNKHKDVIEQSPPDARLRLYFKTKASREEARKALTAVLQEKDSTLDINDKRISLSDDYVPNVFGLDLPEGLMREAYIIRSDLSPIMGWETGRKSEPAYMDMNLHAVREKSEPTVVLYQYDENDPMNPRGLLVAYAEKYVKPVVSDFDTFTIGSKGIAYDRLNAEQCTLVKWCLRHTEAILNSLDHNPWTSRWLEVIKKETAPVKAPKMGFGDPTSYRLIEDVVQETSPCGAIRHGAECCNFGFPQELDDEYLVVWGKFDEKPWEYKTEERLREFLKERALEGYAFNLNPVWPIRDAGWHELLKALQNNPAAKGALEAWYPKDSGILSEIERIRKAHPNGFRILKTTQ